MIDRKEATIHSGDSTSSAPEFYFLYIVTTFLRLAITETFSILSLSHSLDHIMHFPQPLSSATLITGLLSSVNAANEPARILTFFIRRTGLSEAEYNDHWKNIHGPLVVPWALQYGTYSTYSPPIPKQYLRKGTVELNQLLVCWNNTKLPQQTAPLCNEH